MTDSGTADYGPDIMSTVFILGLSDSYTREKLFQLQPKKDKTTVEFGVLVRAESEIQQAKNNCLYVRCQRAADRRREETQGSKGMLLL